MIRGHTLDLSKKDLDVIRAAEDNKLKVSLSSCLTIIGPRLQRKGRGCGDPVIMHVSPDAVSGPGNNTALGNQSDKQEHRLRHEKCWLGWVSESKENFSFPLKMD